MTFGESIRICFSKYADFSGIAGRSEFWWWALFNLIGSLALNVIDYRLSWAWTIATLLPYVAVTTGAFTTPAVVAGSSCSSSSQ